MSRPSILCQSSRAQLILAMPKASSDRLRSCSCLEAGHEQGRYIEVLLVMQDKESLVFYVESLNPGASESVEYFVMNACLVGPFFVT